MLNSHVLHTDLYAFTMLAGALQKGTASRQSTFSLFTRKLPRGRGYGVVAGTHRAITEVRNFSFSDEDIEYLAGQKTLKTLPNLNQFLEYLRGYKFTGTIEGLEEGNVFFENTPIMYIHGEFGECIILEALLLSIMNHDSAIASAASRMRNSAGPDVSLIDMGTRRTHEDAAIASSRAAYMVGFDGTSNVEVARRYAINLVGTTAHAFILLHDSELEAFYAQAESLGKNTIYLVDTYDIEQGIRNAVIASNGNLRGIRIDSGDPAEETAKAKEIFDELGFRRHPQIVISGDMDEYTLAKYAGNGIQMFGVGTNLVTGSGHPTCGMVYKLVERENASGVKEPVAKTSAGKATIPGYMKLVRRYGPFRYTEQLSEEILVHPSRIEELDTTRDGSFSLAHVDLLDKVNENERVALDSARISYMHNMDRLPEAAKGLHVENTGIRFRSMNAKEGENNVES